MIRWAVAGIFVLGCGPRAVHREAPVAPVHEVGAPAVSADAGAAEVSGSADAGAVAEVADAGAVEEGRAAKFFDVEVDPEDAFSLRAKIRHAGKLYEGHSGPVMAKGDGHSVLMWVIVLDADRRGSPRRPRILCRESSHRIAVYVDAGDLATVARREAFVVPEPPIPSEVKETTPGVRLAPGVEIEPLAAASHGRRRLRYKGLFLRVEGWVDADLVGVVYEPAPLADDGVRDGKLLRDVRLLDAPGGDLVARVVGSGYGNERTVHKLGERQKGFVLVRYQEFGASAVGWVESSAVRGVTPEKPKGGWGYGLSGAGSDSDQQVKLARGTPLVGESSGAVLGVVTRDSDFPCQADCKSRSPRVEVKACTGDVSVRARPAK